MLSYGRGQLNNPRLHFRSTLLPVVLLLPPLVPVLCSPRCATKKLGGADARMRQAGNKMSCSDKWQGKHLQCLSRSRSSSRSTAVSITEPFGFLRLRSFVTFQQQIYLESSIKDSRTKGKKERNGLASHPS